MTRFSAPLPRFTSLQALLRQSLLEFLDETPAKTGRMELHFAENFIILTHFNSILTDPRM